MEIKGLKLVTVLKLAQGTVIRMGNARITVYFYPSNHLWINKISSLGNAIIFKTARRTCMLLFSLKNHIFRKK